jgi:hypothetical protein
MIGIARLLYWFIQTSAYILAEELPLGGRVDPET